MSVGQAVLTVDATAMNNPYGAAIPALTYSHAGFQNTDNSAVVTGTPVLTSTASAGSAVGSYTDTVTSIAGLSATNYSFAIGATAVFRVTPVALTITAGNGAMTYGGAVPIVTFSSTGLVNSDVITSVTETTSVTSASPVGSYAVTPSAPVFTHGAAGDYTITYVAGNITVGQAVLTVNATAMTKAYGAAMPVLTYSFAGFQNSDGNGVVAGSPTLTSTATATSAVGSYTDTVTSVAGLSATNYSFAIGATAVFSVTPVALTITAGNGAMTYGGLVPTVTFSSTGLVNSDVIASVTETTSVTATSPVGSYAVTPSAPVFTHGAVGDYTITYVAGNITVGQAVLSVNASAMTKAYGAAMPALTYSFAGFQNTDTSAVVSGTPVLTSTASVGSAVGSYTDTVTSVAGLSATNYSFAIGATAIFSVTPVALTITAGNGAMTYGGAVPIVTFSSIGLVNSDVITSVTETTSVTATSPVGSYAVTPSAPVFTHGAAADYTITYVAGNITVGQAVLTVNASAMTKAYGAAMPALTYSFAGFQNTDTSAVVSGTPVLTSTASVGSAVGSYTDTVTSVAGLSATNYSFAIGATAIFSVTPVALTITAGNGAMTYGGLVPTVTFSTTGLVNSDVITSVTETTSVTATSPVGSYAVTPSAPVFSHGAVGDYTITYVAGNIAITQAVLTVSATAMTKAYGAAMPALTYSFAGFQNTDTSAVVSGTPVLTSTASVGSAVGSYIDTVTSVAGLSATNYSFAIGATAIFSVTPVALTITAGNGAMTYGGAVPIVTFSSTGLVNSDVITSVTETTSVTSASPVGSYAVTPSAPVFTHGAAGDYTITYVAGNITVGQAVLTVNASAMTKAYGAAMPALTYGFAGFQNTDTSAVVSGTPVLTSTATASSAVGSYTDTVTSVAGLSATNYSFAIGATAVFSVTPVALTITAGNGTMSYGAAVPAVTFSATGLVNGDSISSVTETTTASSTVSVGSYPVTPSIPIFGQGAAADYNITFVAGSISVTPATLTVTAGNGVMTYGGLVPTVTFAAAGLQNGDNVSSVTETTVVTSSSPVGSYAVTPSAAVFAHGVATNYAIGYVAGSITVGQAVLTVNASAMTKAYGAAMPALTYSFAGFQNTDTSAVVSGTPVLSSTASVGSAVGSYTDTVTSVAGLSATNYSFAIGATAVFSVTPVALTITAGNGAMTYGGLVPTVTFSATGLVNSDVITSVTESTSVTSTSPVGSYAVTPSAPVFSHGAVGDYTITYVAGNITVGQAVLSVNASAMTKAYGAAMPVLTYSFAGFQNSDGNGVVTGSPTLTSTATATSAVGSYTDTVTSVAGLSATNYSFAIGATAIFSVTPVALTITAGNGAMTYGGLVPTVTFSTTGLVNSDVITSVTETTSVTATSPVGSYAVTPSAPVFSHGAAGDYTITYVAGNITVGQAVLTVNASAMTKAYGAAMPVLTYSFAGFQNSDGNGVVAGSPTLTSTATATSAVGSYTDTVTSVAGLSATNYSFAIGATAIFSVTPVALTITAGNGAMTYGGAVPIVTFSSTGLVNSDVITSVTETTSVTSASPVGSYAVTPSAPVFTHGAAGDYTITYVAGNITVGQAVLTVNASAMTKAYGAAMPALTYSFAGFQNTDTSAVVSGTPVLTSTASVGSAVGSYTDTVTSVAGLSATNYSFAIGATAVFSVTPVALTITAGNGAMTYGGLVPTVTFSSTGLVNSDVITSVTETTSVTATSPVGSYAVTPSAPVFTHGAAGDYTITYVAGNITVGQAVLTVNATAMTKAYGAVMPALTYSFAGFQNSDGNGVVTGSPTLTSTATATSAVGSYTDTVTSVAGLSATNYSFAIGATAIFSVTPVALTITAGNGAMTYGGAVPIVTFSSTGLVNSDVIASVTETTSVTATSPVGSYAVTPSAPVFTHGAAADYTITYVAGNITVGQAVLTVNASAMTKAYGAAMPALTYSFAGFQNTDTSAVVSGTPVLTSTASVGSAVGSYTDTVTSVAGLSATNYSFAIGATAIFSVTPVALTITAGNGAMTYGGAVPIVTFSSTGLVNSDVITSVTETTSVTSASPVGSYAVTPSAPVFTHGAAGDYTITYVAGNITVGQAVLTVNASAMTKAYGAAMPALTYSFAGFQNTDTSAVVSGTPVLTSTASVGSAVGSYTDTVTSVAGLSATNYSFAIGATAIFSVTPVALTITAGNGAMTYGGLVPTVTFSATGLVNSDVITSVTESTSVTSTSPVGSYAVTPSAPVFSHGAVGDYTITYVAGNITVGQAVLSVNASAMTKAYGAGMPVLTYSFAGFQNSDGNGVVTGSPTLTSTATATSAVGSYTDTVTSVAGLSATNYSFAIGATAVFSVTPVALTITAGNGAMTYGGAVPIVTFSSTGLVNSDVITSVTESTSVTSTSPVGSYAVTPSAPVFTHGAAGDYTITYVAGNITVGQAVLTVNASAMTKAYGAAMPALTYSFAGFQNTDTSAVVSGTPVLTSTASVGSAVGSYIDTVTSVAGLSATNYSFAIGATAIFSVTPVALTITAGNGAMTYGGAVPIVTFSSTGLVNSDVITSVTETTSVTSASPVGSYAVTPSAPVFSHGAVGDYTITYVAGNITVGQAVLTVNASAMTKAYGAAMPVLAYSFAGFQNTDTSALVSGTPVLSSTATAASDVGSYTDTVTSVAGLSATNYSFAIGATAIFSVTPVALTITAGNGAMTYGGAVPIVTFSSTGLVNSDVITSVTETTSVTATSPVGSYAVTPSAPVFTHGAAGDYTITYVAGNITVGQAVLTVNATAMTKAYGTAMPVLTYSFAGFQNSDGNGVVAGSPTLTSTATATSGVGSYTDTVTSVAGLSATNYSFAIGATAIFSVTPVALTITAGNGAMTYGGAVPIVTFSSTGLVNSDVITSVTETTSVTATSPVGNYAVTPSAPVFTHGAAGDYTITYVAGNITVGQAVLTVNATAMTKAYGAAMPVLTYSFAGFQNTDTSAVVSGTPVLTSTASVGSGVGSYTDTVTSVAGLSATNYSFAIGATAIFSVTPVALTITAGNGAMTYGGAVPIVTFSTTGLVNSDVIASVTETTSVTATSLVGSYAVTPSAPVFTHGAAGDYTITYVAGNITVGQAVLTVNASAMTKAYGAAMPVLTYSFAGFQNSDGNGVVPGSPILTSTATATSGVGSYTDTVTSVAGLSATNYSFAIGATAVFSVTPVALTITAGNGAMTYGGAVPIVTFSTTGLVNSDVITSVTETTSVTATSPVGSYAVTPSAPVFTHGAAGDYTITYVAGNITVGQAVLTVNASAMTMAYGAAMPVLTYSFAGFQNSDGNGVVAGTPTLTSTATATSGVGSYTDTVTSVAGLSATNYSFAIGATAIFSVTPVALTITAGNGAMTYGGLVPTVTFSTTGLVNSDVIASVTETTSVTATSPVGSYAVTPSAPVFTHGAAADYTITYVAGSITVGQAVVTVNASAMTKAYGAAMPALTYSFAGFQNTDTSAVVSGTPVLTSTATASSAVGSYIDTVTSVAGLSATNYSFAIGATAIFSVTPVALTITAGNGAMTYGGAVPIVTFSSTGLVNSDVIASVTETTSVTATSPVGSYAVTPSAPVFTHGAAGDYTITYVAGNITVGQAVLTVNASAMTKAYGVAMPALTYSFAGFQNTDTSAVVSGTPVLTSTASVASAVGSYTDTVTSVAGLSATNYSFAIGATAVFSVTPVALTITAGNGAMTYGGLVPIVTFSSTGLVNSDVITSVTETTSVTATSPVGNYAVTPSAPVFTHGAAGDYTITYVAGNITVGQAVLTVNASAMTKAYGAAMPVLTYSFAGFQNSDGNGVVTGSPILTSTATATSGVGSYTDTVTSVAGLSATNYSFAIGATAVFSVTPVALTITAGNGTMTYGGAVPIVTFSTAGLVNSDVITSVTESTSVTSTSPVGSYAVTPSAPVFSHGAAGDYTLTYVAGNITVGQAVLTVNATAMTKAYGAAMPALTYSFAGFQNTDTSAVVSGTPVLTSTASVGSAVGS